MEVDKGVDEDEFFIFVVLLVTLLLVFEALFYTDELIFTLVFVFIPPTLVFALILFALI